MFRNASNYDTITFNKQKQNAKTVRSNERLEKLLNICKKAVFNI